MNTYRRDNDYQEPDEIMIPSKEGYIIIPTNTIRVQETSNQGTINKNRKWNTQGLKHFLQQTLIPAGMIALLAYFGFALAGMLGLFVTSAIAGIGFMAVSYNQIEERLRAEPIESTHHERW
jgi:hypothetical protein